METQTVSVPSLLMPLQGITLVLPNAAVAEIVDYRQPEPVKDMPTWMLGLIPWRGLRVPLIAYESVLGEDVPNPNGRLRIAIMNTLNANADLPFFGLVLGGIPSLMHADDATVTRGNEAPNGGPAVLARVDVQGESAIIPDLDGLEKMLNELPA